jgi:hypothetical protein
VDPRESNEPRKPEEEAEKSVREMQQKRGAERGDVVGGGLGEVQSGKGTQPTVTGFEDEGDHKPWNEGGL